MLRSPRWLIFPLIVAAFALTGCPSRKDPAAPGSDENPMAKAARDGILYWGNGTELQDIDPQIVTGVPEHHVLMALGEGLLSENPKDLRPEPGVAERYEVSEDGRTYTFHLRSTARWSNGDPITAQDFYLSYKRMLTPALAAEYANMLYDFVENAEAYYKGEIKDFAQVGFRVIDARTLEVRLRNATPFFPKILASHYSWYPVPVKLIEKLGGMANRTSGWTRPENYVGNGPFRLKEWRYNQVLIVEKNPTYWDRDRVRLNEIWFYTVENQETEERMFRTGRLHRTNEIPLGKIDVYRDAKSPALRIEPFLGSYFYRLNTTRPPFNDVRVRRAMALAVDRESLIAKVTKGGQAPAYRFTPGGFPGYEPKARLQGTVEDAKRLLAEAGYPDGKGIPKIEVLYNTSQNHKQVAEALQQMWRINLGVEVTLRNEEWKVYLDSQDTLNYSMSRSGWIADYVDPHTFLEILVTGGGNNDTGWSNAEYDGLRTQALQAKSEAARFAIYERMEQILVDELPMLPIYHYTRVYLLDPSVKGFYPTLQDNHPYKYIWLEAPTASAAR